MVLAPLPYLLTSFSLYTMVMLILILNNVQYLQMLFLALKKVQIVKIAPPQISTTWWFFPLFSFPTTWGGGGGDFPHPLLLFGKPWYVPFDFKNCIVSIYRCIVDSVKHIKWIFWLQEFDDLKLMLIYNYF